MFLYPKEEWTTMIGRELQEMKTAYNKGQDATILNWGSN